MNLCAITGRLTSRPELKNTPSGASVCNFTLAVERRYSNSDGVKPVDFVDFVAWKSQAEFLCKWFDKGVRVAVTGELQTRMYEDKDSKKIKVCEIVVATVEFADGKREANASAVSGSNENTQTNQASDDIFNNPIFANDGFVPVDNTDELPFN